MRFGAALLILFLLAGGTLAAEPKKEMEIRCERGVVEEVKLYSGESLTFTAIEKQEGITGLFVRTALDEVTFTLMEFDRVRKIGTAIAQGVRRKKIRELRGVPGKPTSFTVSARGACRRLLVVRRSGYVVARVIIHFASFRLTRIWHSLTQNGWDDEHYAAAFEVFLEDPDEKRSGIPLKIETLDIQGRLLDVRTDVALRARERWPERFRSNRRVRISTVVLEPLRDRLARKKSDPLPWDFFTRRPLMIVKGGYLRVSFLTQVVTWSVPFGRRRPRPPGK